MNKKLIQLAKRRERLVTQAAAQRIVLAQNIEPWRLPLARVDQGLAALHFVRNHPATLLIGGMLLSVLRLHRAGKWLQLGWVMRQMRHKLYSK